MKAILKLAVVAFIANLTWHSWLVSSSYYKFRDALQRSSQSWMTKSDDEVKGRVLELASQYNIPLAEEDFRLRRDYQQLFIDGAYTQKIDVLPRTGVPWKFEIHIDSSYGQPLGIKDVVPPAKDVLRSKTLPHSGQ